MNENNIYVIYVGVLEIDDVRGYIDKVKEALIPQSVDGEFIIVPVQSNETKIECINPRYVTEKDLIKENSESIKKLNEHLKFELEK